MDIRTVQTMPVGSEMVMLDIADPKIRLRDIRFGVTPEGWLTKRLWKLLRFKGMCTWVEELVPEYNTQKERN